jgi:hypothetical protein
MLSISNIEHYKHFWIRNKPLKAMVNYQLKHKNKAAAI